MLIINDNNFSMAVKVNIKKMVGIIVTKTKFRKAFNVNINSDFDREFS